MTWAIQRHRHLEVFGESTVGNMAAGHEAPSIVVAFRVARLAKVGVGYVITGKFPPAGTCPHCGHRKDDP